VGVGMGMGAVSLQMCLSCQQLSRCMAGARPFLNTWRRLRLGELTVAVSLAGASAHVPVCASAERCYGVPRVGQPPQPISALS
jgi:hypothetical protein